MIGHVRLSAGAVVVPLLDAPAFICVCAGVRQHYWTRHPPACMLSGTVATLQHPLPSASDRETAQIFVPAAA